MHRWERSYEQPHGASVPVQRSWLLHVRVESGTSADIWVSAVLPSGFLCLWIPSFPLPSLCLPWRVAGSVRGKDGGNSSWPISLNIGTQHHCLPLLLFFSPFLVPMNKEFSACWAHFFVSKFPHRRFYSSLPVTLPTPCSVPALWQGCFVAARRTCLDSLPSETDLVCFLSNSLTQKKSLFVCLRWLLPVKQQKMVLRKELSYLLEIH